MTSDARQLLESLGPWSPDDAEAPHRAERTVLSLLTAWDDHLSGRPDSAQQTVARLASATRFPPHPLGEIFRWLLAHMDAAGTPGVAALRGRHLGPADRIWLFALPAMDGVLPARETRRRLSEASRRVRFKHWYGRNHLLHSIIVAQARKGWWKDTLVSISRLQGIDVRIDEILILAEEYPEQRDFLFDAGIRFARNCRTVVDRVDGLVRIAPLRRELLAEIYTHVPHARGQSYKWSGIVERLLEMGDDDVAKLCADRLPEDTNLAEIQGYLQHRSANRLRPFDQALSAGDLKMAATLATMSSDWEQLAREAVVRGELGDAVEFYACSLRPLFIDNPDEVMNFSMRCGCCTPTLLWTVRQQFLLGAHAEARQSVVEIVRYYLTSAATPGRQIVHPDV